MWLGRVSCDTEVAFQDTGTWDSEGRRTDVSSADMLLIP